MCVGFSFLITSVVAGPAPVGLTTIAGQPAITIRKLLGKKKKKFITYRTWAHTARSRVERELSGSGFIGVEGGGLGSKGSLFIGEFKTYEQEFKV